MPGSEIATPCTTGYFCDVAGLSAPTSNCSAGYYCTLASISPTPTDSVTGSYIYTLFTPFIINILLFYNLNSYF